jgi:hypothetical protein
MRTLGTSYAERLAATGSSFVLSEIFIRLIAFQEFARWNFNQDNEHA